MKEFDPKEFVAGLTSRPGVYRMLDAQGGVLYVGKAANLKKRVGSYFGRHQDSPKTRAMVSQVRDIEVTVNGVCRTAIAWWRTWGQNPPMWPTW